MSFFKIIDVIFNSKKESKKVYAVIIVYIGCVLTLCTTSCETILMAPSPSTKPKAIFLEYANLVKTKYGMLENKGVNIDELITEIAPTIHDTTNDNVLFDKLSRITERLKDGHSALIWDIKNINSKKTVFDILAGYPKAFNYNILYNNYINKGTSPGMTFLSSNQKVNLYKMVYGNFQLDKEISYCWIPSWNAEINDSEIENFFQSIKDSKGLIFDLRGNTGGSPLLSTAVASYFTDKILYPGVERFKIGPGINDFKDSPVVLRPANSANKYLKPVMILTDRHVYSASTTFIYLLRDIERIQTVGQKTGGGSGSIADGFLANGWYWSLSISEYIDKDGNLYDDGTVPDIPVTFNARIRFKDEIIERAIAEIRKDIP